MHQFGKYLMKEEKGKKVIKGLKEKSIIKKIDCNDRDVKMDFCKITLFVILIQPLAGGRIS